MNTINLSMLRSLLTSLEASRSWSPGALEALDAFIKTADDEQLLRVNPLDFAQQHQLSEQESIDLFLFAARLGLFQLEWILFCSLCGCIVENLKSLNSVHSHYRCEACAGETTANLDDFIVVYFQISPSVRSIVFHHPELLPAESYYFRYRYSTDTFFQGGIIDEVPEEMRTRDFFQSYTRLLAELQPGEERQFEVEAGRDLFALDESVSKGQALFLLSGSTSSERALTLTLGALPQEPMPLERGKLSVLVKNGLDRTAHLWFSDLPQALLYLRQMATVKIRQPLLASRVLTNATFKELFRHEVIASDEGIGIRRMAILFSDLKGSTDLYDSIGDLKAFSLVREHFEALAGVIARHSGAIVKTIGDAVMATFISPLDAIHAARDILQEISAFNQRMGRDDLILKIGLHQGAVIAVTLNERVDYFGQTVNIAARVQGLAGAEEICLTDSVYEVPGVADALRDAQLHPETATLKGVAEKVVVYRLARE